MRRFTWTVLSFCCGLLVSWQSALLSNRIADEFAWPLVHLHGCWDIEHCHIVWWGYAVILATIVGPAVLWSVVGFLRAKDRKRLKTIASAVALTIVTVIFYLAFYAVV